ncbi:MULTISPECIES: single-stranded-DNA-specific exonuclease RecJ [Aerococcus]|uniref:Single-stranded-DNA-specific exonuclease RecJ n=2 Tax=Aerococcus TaxID=1375 RepID=A0A178HGC4_9LACT|nr:MULTISPECIES: single-stranded-DNA-specific exonuclease RecJ [Aerococcus]KAA9264431.1 single-stranded-DNA-specific exonuclease RecJ [Aerococcus loyolae]MCY3025495.1 single-stranded-DNA-specific exonuclease RecJ [Aerococcus loyolae]MCY3028333.1 single-stranded-DNA-specific exonuclease RecJ [Aerococcus loyolae]MDK6257217.1 single-stranded-DNA-specific exonuclease RecJ [Aerococcus urinae]MDK6293455.1 single-stranded-DNA-specific exonuclease RecJ [Aerococcus urinae]
MLKANYDWQLRPTSDQSDLEKEQVIKETQLSPLLVDLLFQRGKQNTQEINEFLSEKPHFHDPFLLHDMQKAIDRLEEAVRNNELILIYGDYDADGITATTILYELLESIGANVTYYLPDRFVDGYGPNKEVYAYYIKQGVQLILTCDNGVAGHEAVKYAEDAGVNVIITDHHEIGNTLPEAYAIVHPRHPEGNYPFDDLCGAGVAFKLAQAMTGSLPMEYLDVCAIGTIADLVRLEDENRSIVQQGLKIMAHSERIGLITLMKSQNIDLNQIDEETIAFNIAPRLNALGRLGSAKPGVELLTSFDLDYCQELVNTIEATNQKRRAIVDQVSQQAIQAVEEWEELPEIIILAHSNWHEGVLGIVASRLVEHYQRPSIILNYNAEKSEYKGSGRSVEGINLFKLLQAAKEYAPKSGGHAMAAGMTIAEDQFEAWKAAIYQAIEPFKEQLQGKIPLTIDAKITADQLTLENIQELNRLKPFGSANPKPIFLIENESISAPKQLGKDKNTLKFSLTKENQQLEVIGFHKGILANYLQAGQNVDLVVEASINTWQGKSRPQAILLDMASDQKIIVDWRREKNPDLIFSLSQSYYYFESKHLIAQYKEQIPSHSCLIREEDLEQSREHYRQLVIFELPKNLQKLRDFVHNENIETIYLFSFSPISARKIGMPNRDQFVLLYRYFIFYKELDLTEKKADLAQYLKIPLPLLNLLLKVLVEAGLLDQSGQIYRIRPGQNKIDLKESTSLKNWAKQIEKENFLLTETIDNLTRYFFQEDNL